MLSFTAPFEVLLRRSDEFIVVGKYKNRANYFNVYLFVCFDHLGLLNLSLGFILFYV